MRVNSYYPVLCVSNPPEVAKFYRQHFEFRTVFAADWYVHLQMEANEQINLALVASDHESIPTSHRVGSQGMLLNFEVEDATSIYDRFAKSEVEVLLTLRDEPWGQRHFILAAPEGVMIDVIELIEPSEQFKAQYLSQD